MSRTLKIKQIRVGDIIVSNGFNGVEVVSIEKVDHRTAGDLQGIRLTFNRDPSGTGRTSMSFGAEDTLLVESPGGRKSPENEYKQLQDGDRVLQACPYCWKEVKFPYNGKITRHNFGRSGVCPGSGKTMQEVFDLKAQEAQDRRLRGISSNTSNIVPPAVDTLRDESCPVCGESAAFKGDGCPVCGYEKVPDAFSDPDTSKAKDNGLRDSEQSGEGLDQFRVDGQQGSIGVGAAGLDKFKV